MNLRHGNAPSQKRAIERVERILAAASSVLADHGYAKASTNRIAEHANVHVPSVYRTFANKDAVVAELWDRHVDELMTMLDTMLEVGMDQPIESVVRTYVSSMLALHAARPSLLAVLYAQAPRLPAVRDLRTEAIERLVPFMRHRHADFRSGNLEVIAFVIAAAVEGVARQAVIEPAPPYSTLVDELTLLVTTYLVPENQETSIPSSPPTRKKTYR